MKKLVFISGILLSVCALLAGLYGYFVKMPAFELYLMHTNDLHAHLTPFNPNNPACTYEDKKCLGGFARLKSVVDSYRAKHPDMVLLDGGDRFSGTSFYTINKGKDIVSLMNLMQYDALTLGNHDFDDGLPEIEKMMQNINAPVVSANVVFPKTSALAGQIASSVILNKGGVQIGVIGALTPDVKIESAHAKEIDLKPLIPAVQAEIDSLQKAGVKIIVVLSHIGEELDNALAQSLKDVDIIIGAHSHTLLFKEHNGVLIASAGWAGQQVGAMRVVFNRLGQMLSFENETVPLNNAVQPNQAVKQQIEGIVEQLKDVLRRPVLFLDKPVLLTENKTFCGQKCHIGEVLSDAVLSAFPEVDIAFLNSGAIRSGLAQGDVNVGDVMQVYPFDSSLALVEMTGRQIADYIAYGIQKYKADERVNALLHPAGLTYAFDGVQKRVEKINVNGQPIDLDKTYKVALPLFLAEGGDGFPAYPVIKELSAGLRGVLMNTLRAEKYQVSPLQSRVVDINQ